MAGKNILDLKTVTQKFHITIDGKPFELRPPGMLPLAQTIRAEELVPEIFAVSMRMKRSRKGFSRDDIDRFAGLLMEFCALVVDAPPEVLATLSDTQRLQIVEVFMKLPLSTTRPTVEAARLAKTSGPSTTATSFRGSPGSTRARRSSTGGIGSRAASSRRA